MRRLDDALLVSVARDPRKAADIAAEHGVSQRTVERWRLMGHRLAGSAPRQGLRPGTVRETCPRCGHVSTVPEAPA